MQRAAAPMRRKALLWSAWRFAATEILAQSKRTFTLPWEEWLREPLRARMEVVSLILSRRWLLPSLGAARLCGRIFLLEKPAGRVPVSIRLERVVRRQPRRINLTAEVH